ncbi:MAG TPA: serine/threonine protein kinase, partial [Planctomycetaceae bacterium]|nr:serine/threonine protein kinase [Planctomycetaceae bacterium]
MTSKKFTFAPESTPLAGFTIKRGIQRGGFGEVYYAISDGGKEVALKLLHSHVEIERRGTELCLNLKHPNLVSIIDIRHDEDGDTWVVMEYVSGATLDRVLADDFPEGMPIAEVRTWLAGLAAGVDYLHDRGIV